MLGGSRQLAELRHPLAFRRTFPRRIGPDLPFAQISVLASSPGILYPQTSARICSARRPSHNHNMLHPPITTQHKGEIKTSLTTKRCVLQFIFFFLFFRFAVPVRLLISSWQCPTSKKPKDSMSTLTTQPNGKNNDNCALSLRHKYDPTAIRPQPTHRVYIPQCIHLYIYIHVYRI